ncbi:hypothetical protein MSAN_01579500 [Mycena sanguinolenta]|uniref:Uncharacterized protein n=1 Tax=Mycena sanguinolenta TaxID=230812 RepID=A0A8H6Y1D9_9AGAR|nr:hypothetical protein MSAN_01579500 [Mycena sanguinolenta]
MSATSSAKNTPTSSRSASPSLPRLQHSPPPSIRQSSSLLNSLVPLGHSPPPPSARRPLRPSSASSPPLPPRHSPPPQSRLSSPTVSPVESLRDLVPPVETLGTEASPEVDEAEPEPDTHGNSDINGDENELESEPEWHGISSHPRAKIVVAKKPIPRLGNAVDDDDDDAALPDVPGLTTWAKRNPGKPVLRSKPKQAIRPEQRRTLEDRAKSKKKRMVELQADIAQLNRARVSMIDELAVKHRFKLKLVKQQISASTAFKKSRKPSLIRAKIHYLTKVLNEGLAKNERFSLHEIRRRVANYPEFRNMSREFKTQLLKDLEEHRSTRKTGTRATNKAVAQDAAHVMKKLDEEIRNLFERRGMYGIAIFSKGHVQDKALPHILESASASNFIRETLKIDPMDLVAKFEQWCCSRDLGFTGVDTLPSMRKEVTRMVKGGLRIASKKEKCVMNYERYFKVVILGYGVIIVGWPKGIDFVSPTYISSVDDMRKLRDAWRDGTCHWKILSVREKEKYRKDYDDKVASGGDRRGGKAEAAGEKSRVKSRVVVEDKGKDKDKDEDEDINRSEEEPPRRTKTSGPCRKSAPSKKSGPSKTSVTSTAISRATRKDDQMDTGQGEEGEEPVKDSGRERKSTSSMLGSKKDESRKSDQQKERERAEKEKSRGEKSGRKRKHREGNKGRPGLSKKSRRGEGSSKRQREDDEEEDEPAAKKTKGSDSRPKPRPRYKKPCQSEGTAVEDARHVVLDGEGGER